MDASGGTKNPRKRRVEISSGRNACVMLTGETDEQVNKFVKGLVFRWLCWERLNLSP